MANVLDEAIERNPEKSFNMLELGAGTGSMSKYIHNHMRDQDHLDMVEIEKPLYEQLQKKFKDAGNVAV
jgi:phospholipid N-methyltransferase